ncbi:hypothetical protein AB1Y20_022324 [Prymnesium parvum]|uniref:Protein xylosyltransferase n=1 Tax=Prymnesium parvum TaxID=97485 RepID=A0AB34JGU8_PRYPA
MAAGGVRARCPASRPSATEDGRLKAVIVFLMIGDQYAPQLQRSVPLVCAHWPGVAQIPVVIVHHATSAAARAAVLRSVRGRPCNVLFEHWDLGSPRYPWPSWLDENASAAWAQGEAAEEALVRAGWCACNGNRLACGKFPAPAGSRDARCRQTTYASYKIGYCHMGFFRTRDLFGLDVLASAEWLINLDSNVNLHHPLPYDPVAFLASQGKVFGMLSQTRRAHDAADACYDGFHSALRSYLELEHISLVDPRWPPPDFSGNFFIAYLPLFRARAWTSLAHFFAERTTGLYSHRWGEQALLSAAVMTCYSLDRTHVFHDLRRNGTLVHDATGGVAKLEQRGSSSAAYGIWNGGSGIPLAPGSSWRILPPPRDKHAPPRPTDEARRRTAALRGDALCVVSSHASAEHQLIGQFRECGHGFARHLTNVTPIHPTPYHRARPSASVRLEFAVVFEQTDVGEVEQLLDSEYAIVISTHNEAIGLRSTFRPLLQLTVGSWQLVMILDDSNDDSARVVASELLAHASRPRTPRQLVCARVLRAASPGLYEVAALNLGMRLLSPRGFYILLQADMLLGEPGWNRLLSLPLRQYADLFVVSGRCAHDYPLGQLTSNSSRTPPTAGRCSRKFFSRIKNVSAAREAGAAVRDSANIGPFVVRGDAMRSLGFFDEQRYHLGGGFEHDLCVRGFGLLGLRAAYYAIDVYTRQEWRVTPRSGALRPDRVAATQALLGVDASGAYESSAEALALPRRHDLRQVDLGRCSLSVDGCAPPPEPERDASPSREQGVGALGEVHARSSASEEASGRQHEEPIYVVVFTLKCEGSEPFNSSCFAMSYYETEMHAYALASVSAGIRLFRHTTRGPVAPIFGEATASVAKSAVRAVWLMHEIANAGSSKWREHRSPLELALLRASSLYPCAPAVVMVTKVWKDTSRKMDVLRRWAPHLLHLFVPVPIGLDQWENATGVPTSFAPFVGRHAQPPMNRTGAEYRYDVAMTGAMAFPAHDCGSLSEAEVCGTGSTHGRQRCAAFESRVAHYPPLRRAMICSTPTLQVDCRSSRRSPELPPPFGWNLSAVYSVLLTGSRVKSGQHILGERL